MTSYTARSHTISHLTAVSACPARCRACIPAWIHCASARSRTKISFPIAGCILLLTQRLFIAVSFQMRPGGYAVLCCPVRSGPVLDPPGFEFGSEHFTNQVKTHHRRRRHPLPHPRARLRGRRRPRVHPRRLPQVAGAQALGPRGTIPRACA